MDVHTADYQRRRFLIGSSSALIALVLLRSTASAAAAGVQYSWRRCAKCYQVFFDGYPSNGICPMDGYEHATSLRYNYGLEHDDSRTQWLLPYVAQYDWRFCTKCYTLFYDGYASKGVCAGGGGHAAQGFMFRLWDTRTPISESARETNWRWCQKCYVLFYAGFPPNFACPAGGGHAAQGFDYFLNFAPLG
jgi:hypothetical protein